MLRFLNLILGLFLYAVGIVLTIEANIGYGPWEVFYVGLSAVTGISIGSASIIVGVVIVLITILMGERIGIGTLLNMLLIGFFLDALLVTGIVPKIENRLIGIAVLIPGFAIGFCVHSSFMLLKFNPTMVRHSTLSESFMELKAVLSKK